MVDNFFPYPGGKTIHSDWILQFLPSHTCYVEPFGGSASILFLKKPSEIEVYNDKDNLLVNLFRVVRDPIKSQRLFKLLKNTLYSRAEHRNALFFTQFPHFAPSDVELAWATYLSFYFNYASKLNSGFRYSNEKNNTNQYYNSLRNLIWIRERLKNVVIENLDYADCIDRYDGEETLFYVDPPYFGAGTVHYRIGDEFRTNLKPHEELAQKLKTIKGMCVLSGYENPIYDEILNDWHKEYKATKTTLINKRQSNNPKERVEILYINPQAWERLKIKQISIYDAF